MVIINISEWIGTEIGDGRYKVLGRVGEESMGHVYRAFDRHLETDVVVKFPIAPDAREDDIGFLERFSREIRSLVRLSHPHIVRVIDVGEHRGHPYVVMQYLAGDPEEPDGDGARRRDPADADRVARDLAARRGPGARPHPRPAPHPPRRQAVEHPLRPA